MTPPIKLAVWDIDGTLVDSRAIIFDCCRHALTTLGEPDPSYDAVRQIVGLSLVDAMAILAPEVDPEGVQAAAEAYKARFQTYRDRPGFKEPLYPGAVDTLRRLRAEGWRMAIATGKSRRGVEAIVRVQGWQDLFDSAHCADDGPGKPHPAMLLAAVAACGAQPEEAVMIGDSAHDMRMALAAGVRAQGVSWGFNTAAELADAGAHHVSHDFSSLNAQLDLFSGVLV
ncbi:MAG TPA: HAD-IA family hydrolase [Caulobacteraceae bacterium]|nr:HAD-IA family hydrolase [Caulobacteraceae bacterium]